MRFRYNLVKPTSAFDERASASMHRHTPIKVRYGETDMMGVVYHANYLLYFEDARIDFLDALGFSYAERIEGAGYMSPIHDIEIHYKAPLRYGEAGVVRTSVAKNLPMRTVYRQQVFRADDAAGTDEAGFARGRRPARGRARHRVRRGARHLQARQPAPYLPRAARPLREDRGRGVRATAARANAVEVERPKPPPADETEISVPAKAIPPTAWQKLQKTQKMSRRPPR